MLARSGGRRPRVQVLPWKTKRQLLNKKLDTILPYDPKIAIVDIYSGGNENVCSYKNLYRSEGQTLETALLTLRHVWWSRATHSCQGTSLSTEKEQLLCTELGPCRA